MRKPFAKDLCQVDRQRLATANAITQVAQLLAQILAEIEHDSE
jgi:hypothetical protein